MTQIIADKMKVQMHLLITSKKIIKFYISSANGVSIMMNDMFSCPPGGPSVPTHALQQF